MQIPYLIHWRTLNGLPQYIKDGRTCEFAQQRACEATKDYSHDDFKKQWIEKVCTNRSGPCRAGENFTANYLTPELAMDGWLNSGSHVANLKDDYKYSFIGQFERNYAQIFLDY